MGNPTECSGIEPVQAWPDNTGKLHYNERDALTANLNQQFNGARGRVEGFFTRKGYSANAPQLANTVLSHWAEFLPLMEQLHNASNEYKRLGR